MFNGDLDLATSTARFEALDEHEKAQQWTAYLDALDAGGVGHHPHHLHLSGVWEREGSPAGLEGWSVGAAGQARRGSRTSVMIEDALGSPPF